MALKRKLPSQKNKASSQTKKSDDKSNVAENSPIEQTIPDFNDNDFTPKASAVESAPAEEILADGSPEFPKLDGDLSELMDFEEDFDTSASVSLELGSDDNFSSMESLSIEEPANENNAEVKVEPEAEINNGSISEKLIKTKVEPASVKENKATKKSKAIKASKDSSSEKNNPADEFVEDTSTVVNEPVAAVEINGNQDTISFNDEEKSSLLDSIEGKDDDNSSLNAEGITQSSPNLQGEQEWDLDELLSGNNNHDSDNSYEEIKSFADENEDTSIGAIDSDANNNSSSTKDKLPPWQQGASSGEPPILPGSEFGDGGKAFGNIFVLVLVAVVLYGGYVFFVKKDSTAEFLARWTGSLQEVSEDLPEDISISDGQDVLVPEKVVGIADANFAEVKNFGGNKIEVIANANDGINQNDEFEKAESVDNVAKDKDTVVADNAAKSKTVVEFVEVEDAPKEEEVAEMPDELSLFAEIQSAVMKAKEEKDVGELSKSEQAKLIAEIEKEQLTKLSPEEKERISRDRIKGLDNKLADYRKTLAGAKGEKPQKVSPKDFFEEKVEVADGADIIDTTGEVGKSLATNIQANASKKSEVKYGSNPYGLPVIPEPSDSDEVAVRDLSDFNVTLFEPPMARVRIPKNVRPAFRSAGFPELQVLSFIPGKGLIANSRGREGVLMIGETLDGWELISVANSYAEFGDGSRKHVVALEQIGFK